MLILTLYDSGQGVEQDYAEAAKWYLKAAKQEQAFAQSNLGTLYNNGQGVEQDYAEAAKWWHRAADQDQLYGYGLAQLYGYGLAQLYGTGSGVSQDYREAAKWLEKAAEQGDAKSQNDLGFIYARGQGVEQDYAEAAKWFRRAAKQGYPDARRNLEMATTLIPQNKKESSGTWTETLAAGAAILGAGIMISQALKDDNSSGNSDSSQPNQEINTKYNECYNQAVDRIGSCRVVMSQASCTMIGCPEDKLECNESSQGQIT